MIVANMTALKICGKTLVPELVMAIKKGDEEIKLLLDGLFGFNAGSLYGTSKPIKNNVKMKKTKILKMTLLIAFGTVFLGLADSPADIPVNSTP